MIVAIWIIAVCEVIRALQNMMQIGMYKRDTGSREDAYKAFVDSLKVDDREMVKKLLMEFEHQEDQNSKELNK